jgi:hypothetical protein
MIQIASDRLTVEMLEPGSPVYTRTRFDWTGFVTQVTLDGATTFCVPESLVTGEGTGGIGLCNEFGTNIPVGYDDAKAGEQFPKIGIGLLTRVDDKEYSPFFPYPLQPFPMHVEIEKSTAVFAVDPVPVRGYAVRLVKRVEAVESRLVIHYCLENVGEKTIETSEYNHNFVGIDGAGFGPDYELSFPFAVKSEAPGPFEVDRGKITWPSKPEQAYCRALSGYEGMPAPWWNLKLRTNGAAIREQPDFAWTRCIFFGTAHLVSTEVFVGIHVEPGNHQEWTREYTFTGPGRS